MTCAHLFFSSAVQCEYPSQKDGDQFKGGIKAYYADRNRDQKNYVVQNLSC